MHLPPILHVPGKPQLIMRAVYGHLAAQGVERYLKGPETEALRDAFLDPNVQLPDNVRFYYWPFPYRDCIIFRDAALMDLRTGNVAVIWLLKFFPISFMVAWEKTERHMFTVSSLTRWRDRDPDGYVDIPVPLTSIPNRYWPQAPTRTSIVMYGEEAMYAVPHE